MSVSSSTVIDIADGATLSGAGTQAPITVTSPLGGITVATIQVDGTVSGVAAGIAGYADAPNIAYPNTRLDITIGGNGAVYGQSGILFNAVAGGTTFRTVGGTLDNSGLVEGSIYGLRSFASSAGFLSVTNRASGIIRGSEDAIVGPVGNLTNAGLIDGGYGAAYDIEAPSGNYAITPSNVINTGIMRSAGSQGTLAFLGGDMHVTNGGTIDNTNGPAVIASNYLYLTNQAGGVIASDGLKKAVIASGGATIVNKGTINGLVSIGGPAGSTSRLDNTQGTINGNVAFGAGDDVLTVSWDTQAGRIAGVSGTIDGGGGTNTLLFGVEQDGSVDSMLSQAALPTNFQKIGVTLDNVTATLGIDAPDGLLIGGAGTFITTGHVTSAGRAFTVPAVINTDSPALRIINSGDILADFSPSGTPYQYGDYALSLFNLGSFENSGTITATAGNGVWFRADEDSTSHFDKAFLNTGTIIADGTALQYFGEDNIFAGTATNSGKLISTSGVAVSFTQKMTNTGTITGATMGVDMTGVLTNSGAITATNGPGIFMRSSGLDNLAGGVITGSGDAIVVMDGGSINNAGVINGNVNLSQNLYNSFFFDKGGTVNGNITFGGGNNFYITDVSKYDGGRFTNVSGSITGGGNNTLALQVGADASARIASLPSFQHIEYDVSNGARLTLSSDTIVDKTLMLAGAGSVDVTADFHVSNAAAISVSDPIGFSANSTNAVSVVSHGNMIVDSSSPGVYFQRAGSFENAGTITISRPNQVYYGCAGAGIVGVVQVTNSGAINTSNAAAVCDALKVVNTGSITGTGDPQASYYPSSISSVNSLDNRGSIVNKGSAVELNAVYSSGTQFIDNSGLIRSTGGDTIVQNQAYADINITNTSTGSIVSDKHYAIITGALAYKASINNAGTIIGNIQTYYGKDRIENSGSITGNIDTSLGDDLIESGGAIKGAVNLGDGDDTLRLTGGSFTGSADGGTGSDRLELAVTGNTPLALGTSTFSNFEVLDMQSGTAVFGGDSSFGTIRVSGGRLIGVAGSTFRARTIFVAPGATFGSAQTVAGDLTVAGTLSPGASPGTMTVVGNVSLAGGSTSLFELTPTVSDKLVVLGALTIAPGATLQLSGTVAPGRRLDLITASGGINGTFSTILSTSPNLHLVQSANSLQGLGLFSTSTSYSPQVSGLIDTLNSALIDDKLGASLVAALPALVDADTGESDPQALIRLTPQAYASAPQLAGEDAMAIVDATREETHFAADRPGAFAYGQAIDSSRKLAGDRSTGVDSAKMSVDGAIGGVGYGARSAWVAAFVGHLNGSERLSGLDARTTTDSFVAGAQGQVRGNGFRLGAMVAYDRADASTRRLAPGGLAADGRYALKSWIANLDLSYRARLNAGWIIEPRLSATAVHTTRDGVTETGGGAFALSVLGGKSRQGFIDGRVEFEGGQQAGKALHPFVAIGFVSRTGGEPSSASASLAGLSVPLTADGLDRDGTRALAAAGLRYDLSDTLKASAGYSGEFGRNGRQRVSLGLHWAF